MGHRAGDQLLQAMAEALERVVRRQDLVVRYGGDEFVVLLPEGNAAAAPAVVARVRAYIEGAATLPAPLR